jgi:hypothetical protein
MNKLLMITLLTVTALTAQSHAPKTASKPVLPLGVPAGAVKVDEYFYRYTDSKGKVWMYRETPFGVQKWEDKPTAAPPPIADTPNPVTTTDLGDKIKFERNTPFGPQIWTTKKSELSEYEKAMLNPAKTSEKDPPAAHTDTEKKQK